MSRVVLLVGIALLCATSAHAESLVSGAEDTNAVYRNAMYLFLRIAGVAWIGLEWVAAFVLWRAYRMLSSALKEKQSRA